MQILVATTNAHKFEEISNIITDHSLKQIDISVNEDGISYKENALKKAISLSKNCNDWVLADDSGLEVEVLGDYPGIYSARLKGCNYDEKINYLLSLIGNNKNRQACFKTAIVLCKKNTCFIFEGECCGSIGYEKRGNNGFGYDPIFYLSNGKTLAELTSFEKNEISHRSKAVNLLRRFLSICSKA